MDKLTYIQLAEENRLLKEKIAELKQADKKQGDNESIYRALFEHAGFSIAFIKEKPHKRIFFNKAEYESLGYSKGEFEKLSEEAIIIDKPEQVENNNSIVNEQGVHFFETRQRAKNGDIRHKFISSVKVPINEELYHLNIASDITYLKETEKDLKEVRGDLEERVERRTAELIESNTALKVLLQKQDEAIEDIEGRLLGNTRQLILPHLENLKKTHLTERQTACLMELELNLKDILSPFLKRLSNRYHNLSPIEIKVAAHVRGGKTTKEIADLLAVSIKTIEFHRDNLRKKLGIKYKKINLQSHLQTLDLP